MYKIEIVFILTGLVLSAFVSSLAHATPDPEGGCPPGWVMVDNDSDNPDEQARATQVDEQGNHDGFVCVMSIPGEGGGDVGLGANIKDNNQPLD